MPAFDDLTGRRFGAIIAISRNFDGPKPRWNCQCDCGSVAVLRADYLKTATFPSCGCRTKQLLSETSKSHGLSKSPEYRTWIGIRARCYKPSNAAYYKYGARGIRVCDRWQRFENFYADMGPKPSPLHTIDRLDGTKDYGPDNCRWATPPQQQRNIRTNVVLHHNGKGMIAADWAKITGMDAKTIQSRIYKLGWTVEEALTLPLHFHHKHRR